MLASTEAMSDPHSLASKNEKRRHHKQTCMQKLYF